MELPEVVKLVQDNTNMEKRQAEALSAAIDALNRGGRPENVQDTELAELVFTASLIKESNKAALAPPPAMLDHLVNQAAHTITREKQKRRLAWGLASLSSAVAAVLLVALLNSIPPSTPDRELAKAPAVPAPVAEEVKPPAITVPPPNLTSPPARAETPPSAAKRPTATPQPGKTAPAQTPPEVALVPPKTPVPAASDTMLALANRKADVVTIDAASKSIRQVYRKGAPDEIIITQAPKRPGIMRSMVTPPPAAAKQAAPVPGKSGEIKPPNRNKVQVTVDNTEVTLEGAASEEELLNLAKTLTEVSVANEK